jgi:hypothetical protein
VLAGDWGAKHSGATSLTHGLLLSSVTMIESEYAMQWWNWVRLAYTHLTQRRSVSAGNTTLRRSGGSLGCR